MTIEQIIFSHLALREGLNLPSVGSLSIREHDARFQAKGQLLPPYVQVVFSKRSAEGAVDLITLISSDRGCSYEQALKLFNEWLDGAKQDSAIVLEGVGVIHRDFFTAAEPLAAILDPYGRVAVRIKRKRSVWKCLVVIIIVLAILAAAYVGTKGIDQIKQYVGVSFKMTTPEEQPLVPVEVDSVSLSLPDDSTQVEAVDTLAVSSDLYHIIGGLYSTDENADRFIVSAKGKYPDTLHFEKIVRENGKIMVSIYSTDDKQRAIDVKNALLEYSKDLWVFHQSR